MKGITIEFSKFVKECSTFQYYPGSRIRTTYHTVELFCKSIHYIAILSRVQGEDQSVSEASPRDALSKGHIVQGTHCPFDTLSKDRIVQGTHCPRAASSKGRIVQGTHCPWDGTSETFCFGTHRLGTLYHVISFPVHVFGEPKNKNVKGCIILCWWPITLLKWQARILEKIQEQWVGRYD